MKGLIVTVCIVVSAVQLAEARPLSNPEFDVIGSSLDNRGVRTKFWLLPVAEYETHIPTDSSRRAQIFRVRRSSTKDMTVPKWFDKAICPQTEDGRCDPTKRSEVEKITVAMESIFKKPVGCGQLISQNGAKKESFACVLYFRDSISRILSVAKIDNFVH